MAVKLSKLILDELEYPIDDVYYWTDSMSVIRYIANDTSRFHTFVANRVNVIREASQVHQWKYIDSKTNPADAASRGMRMDNFLKADFWFNGPGFLWKPETEWLDVTPETDAVKIDSDDPEVKKTVNVAVVSESCDVIDRLLCYFSDWMKLKRAVVWILLVIRQLQTVVKYRKSKTKQISLDSAQREADRQRINYLSINVLKAAEMAIIRVVQWRCFLEEMLALSQEKNGFKHNKRSIIQKLDPILHEGIMRVGGRLEKAIIRYDAKHPIILPKESHVSALILQDIHKRMGHFGKNVIMSVLRQQYWMIGSGTVITRLLSKCVVCRKYQARVLEKKMANLPADRLTSDEPPFTRVGMDYFGPILVKRGRSTVKRYGIIFTCLAIRAVHLEMAYSLDMDSCINCVRRFIARRGP
ncbi:uncharacterized protein LOC121385021 [Gigantopelta aegis]|uniref:uncharacterized protein LOC121385021 n=1 Tax=Gigantopelta aegis TaxID=1735272 RepID=UPI001B88B069|nr:uncharacterized protein LOC121385021 [Gigantopelta aegis]